MASELKSTRKDKRDTHINKRDKKQYLHRVQVGNDDILYYTNEGIPYYCFSKCFGHKFKIMYINKKNPHNICVQACSEYGIEHCNIFSFYDGTLLQQVTVDKLYCHF